MAHDTKYTKLGNPNKLGYHATGVVVDSLKELPDNVGLSPHQAAKAKMTKQGKHKGSVLYTKYDK